MDTDNKRDRIKDTAAVFFRHGIKKGIKGSIDPVNIRLAFEELGPTYVKIGQMLSMRPDIIPSEYRKEFRKLQDSVRPEKFEDIRSTVENSLHKPLCRLFAYFGKDAVASASLSEVHRARLLTGEEVAVKIRRPGVGKTLLTDISILRLLCRFYGIIPVFNFINIKDALSELERNAKRELDFLNEAENIKKFRLNNENVKCVASPKVYGAYTTDAVLVMEYIHGIKIDDTAALEENGYDLDDIGKKLAGNYMKQIFEDGFFHADPHPGNLVVANGKIVYLDFGLMGSLEVRMVKKMNALMHGVVLGDPDAIAKAVLRIGTVKKHTDTRKFYGEISEFYGKYADAPFDTINIAEIIGDMSGICVRNGIVMPGEVTMLGKGLITIESVLTKISPGINTMKIAADYAGRNFFSLTGGRPEATDILKDLYQFSYSFLRIPVKVSRFIDMAQSGRLTVNIENPQHDKQMETANRMINRLVFGLVIAALIIGSSIIISSNAGSKFMGVSILGAAGYAGAAVFGFWLLISIIRSNRL